MANLALGVDLGATYVRVAIGDSSRILLKTSERTVNQGDEYAVTNQIIRLARKILKSFNKKIVGIGSIGP